MLRRIFVNDNKAAPANLKASEEMVRGMLVTKNYSDGTVGKATGGKDFFFVDKQTDMIGIYSVQGELSDYTVDFENIAVGELVVIETPQVGEQYATDQITATGLSVGDGLVVANGLFVKAGADAEYMFKYAGVYNDNSHTLHKVDCVNINTGA